MKAPLYIKSARQSSRQAGRQVPVHKTSSQEDHRVDNTNNPFVSALALNTEFLVELQVRSVGPGLIPSLCRGADGTESDGVPEHPGAMPFVGSLVLERILLVAIKTLDVLEPIGVSRNEGCAAKEFGVLGQVVVLGEGVRIVHDLFD